MNPAGLILGAALLLAACSGPEEVRELRSETMTIVLEAPLFEGPNPGQYEWVFDLAESLQLEGPREVKRAHLTQAVLTPGDSLGFQQIRSFVLSLASDHPEVSMQEVAFVNPVDASSASISMEVAEAADVAAHLAEGKAYVVLDVDLAEDEWELNRTLSLDLTLELGLN